VKEMGLVEVPVNAGCLNIQSADPLIPLY
jgi:hypothetical protein